MITQNEWESLSKAIPEFRKTCKQKMHERIAALDEIQSADISNNRGPDKTYAEFESRFGKGIAQHTIACLVNQSAWDGRISPRNAEWAKSVPGSFDEQTMTFEIGEYTKMHKCHLDQIANAARRAN